MATSCDLFPEDVLYHILLWLPVVSLLRFKSVCKAWYSLIQSSDFITQHLHLSNSTDNNNNKVIAFAPEMLNFRAGPFFTLRFVLLSGNNFQMTEYFDLPHRFDDVISCHGEFLSCNGVICLVHRYRDYTITHDVSLWNPATKQFRILPKSAVPLPEWYGGVHFSYGFGFDKMSNDYKVVRITHVDYILDEVEVYSLNTDSWRVLDVVLPNNAFSITSNPKTPFQNGIYCWSGYEVLMENGLDKYHNYILSFDFAKEVFGTMPLPDVYSFVRGHFSLALLWETLACFDWLPDPPKPDDWHCEIWVLNEYGVKESWTKLYTVVLETLAFTRFLSMNGLIVWMKRVKSNPVQELSFCVCNPLTQELMKLPFDVFSFRDLLFANYKESLVSIAATRIPGVVDV